MKTHVFLCVVLAAIAMVQAEEDEEGLHSYVDPNPFRYGPWNLTWINHDDVVPFNDDGDGGRRYRPTLYIEHGCHSYPAVDIWGRTNAGLKPTGDANGDCKGSGHGSQVYGRADWFRGVWAVMFAWYFPKDAPSGGHRHDWENIIVWINNPEVDYPEIKAVSASEHVIYKSEVPPNPDHMEGTSVKVAYYYPKPAHHTLKFTTHVGEIQSLIMWNELTEYARIALNTVDWEKVTAPMNDANFKPNLEKAWPFGGAW